MCDVVGIHGLGKARLSSWDVAPLLDHWLLDLPGVGPGPGADLLGDIHTLLRGLQLGHKLGDMGAGPLGLQATLFLGGILDNCLGFVIALLRSLCESTSSGCTDLPGLLGAASDGRVLLYLLLGSLAHLSWPLRALGEGGIAGSFVLALLILNSLALNNIILNIMDLLLGPAFRLVLSPADLRAGDLAIFNQRGTADLNSLIEGNLLILDEAILSEILLAFLLLLGLIVGHISGVAPLVIAVVTLNHIIILSLLDHLNLVNASLTISSSLSSSNCSKAHIRSCFSFLSAITSIHLLDKGNSGIDGRSLLMMAVIMVMVMVSSSSILSIEGEGVYERALSSGLLHHLTPQLAGSLC
jgi:hypothetical protein